MITCPWRTFQAHKSRPFELRAQIAATIKLDHYPAQSTNSPRRNGVQAVPNVCCFVRCLLHSRSALTSSSAFRVSSHCLAPRGGDVGRQAIDHRFDSVEGAGCDRAFLSEIR
jgi:hypothetical protein